jgi:hypothetical protein
MPRNQPARRGRGHRDPRQHAIDVGAARLTAGLNAQRRARGQRGNLTSRSTISDIAGGGSKKPKRKRSANSNMVGWLVGGLVVLGATLGAPKQSLVMLALVALAVAVAVVWCERTKDDLVHVE